MEKESFLSDNVLGDDTPHVRDGRKFEGTVHQAQVLRLGSCDWRFWTTSGRRRIYACLWVLGSDGGRLEGVVAWQRRKRLIEV